MPDINIAISGSSAHSSWKDFLPLISSSVVIILFIIDRVLAARLRKKEVERNWYLKILVEPSVAKISAFYLKSIELFDSSYETLRSAINTESIVSNYLKLVSVEIGKFQSIKREFESEVIFPIQVTYPEIGDKLTSLLLKMEDDFSEFLASHTFTSEEMNKVRKTLSTNRSVFINTLYDPIK